jgi:hypothetical protein
LQLGRTAEPLISHVPACTSRVFPSKDLRLLSATAAKELHTSAGSAGWVAGSRNTFRSERASASFRRQGQEPFHDDATGADKTLDLLHVPSPRRCKRQNGDKARVNGPPPRSAATSDFYSCILFFLLHSHRRANIWGLRAPQANMANSFHPLEGRIVGLPNALHTEQMGVHSNTGACARRHTAKAPLPATTTTKHNSLHPAHSSTILPDNTPTRHTVHAGQQPVSRAQTSRAANLSCSWASFPCLMPKRPPSRCGKVASNLFPSSTTALLSFGQGRWLTAAGRRPGISRFTTLIGRANASAVDRY